MQSNRLINRELKSPPPERPACKQAKDYVQKIESSSSLSEKFRTYRLASPAKEKEGRKRIILVMGCQGTGGENQEMVAARMEKVIARLKAEGYEIACVLSLGDNVYSKGATSPHDSRIHDCCEGMYTKFPNLAATPFFYIQGNHDQNRHFWGMTKGCVERGLKEVAHTFMPDAKHRTVDAKIALFNQKCSEDEYILDTETLSHFNMPGRIYSLICDDMEIFCIDSNTYVKDYMDYKAGKPGTQAEWLEKKMQAARDQGRKPILALHHPPHSLGERVYNNDVGYYLSEADEKRARAMFAKRLGNTDKSYNALVNAVLEEQGLKFDTILAAHDHGMSYYNDGRTPQVVSGGGGGSLQDRFYFEDNKNVASFMESFGFVILESDREKLNYAFYNTHPDPVMADYPLMFNNKSLAPVREKPDDDELARIKKYCLSSETTLRRETHPGEELQKVNDLCNATKEAIDNFMQFMARKQRKYNGNFFSRNYRHDHAEIKRAHLLQAYISNPHIACYHSTLVNIMNITNLTKSNTRHHYLNNYLTESFKKHKIKIAELESNAWYDSILSKANHVLSSVF